MGTTAWSMIAGIPLGCGCFAGSRVIHLSSIHTTFCTRDPRQLLRAPPLTAAVRMGVAAVGGEEGARVDDRPLAQLARSASFRRTMAELIAATSSNSSPKKPSGQLSISPHSLSRKSSSLPAPRDTDEK